MTIHAPIKARRPTPAATRKLTTTLHPDEMPPRYAMICDGHCLDPIFKHGTKLMFDRDAPFRPGDFVVLFKRPELVQPGDHQMIVKRLVMSPGQAYWQPGWVNSSGLKPTVLFEQINPLRLFEIEADHLLGIHKCLGEVPADTVTSDHVLSDDEVRREFPRRRA